MLQQRVAKDLPLSELTLRRYERPSDIKGRELVKRLLEFPQIAVDAAERRAPHALPNYAIRVADDFHRFYHRHRVLGPQEEGFRLGLCAATQHVIRRSLDLIGVHAPERM
jgi:arginyl-tRNA synthetase